MKAFVVSAFLAGMAGALYAMNYGSITASKFNFNTSINILVFVVLGGMGALSWAPSSPPPCSIFCRRPCAACRITG